MSLDMSTFLSSDHPNDWTPATFNNLNVVTLTFSAGGESIVREFASPLAALSLMREMGFDFEFSPSRNAVRTRAGDVILLPTLDKPRVRVEPSKCTLVAKGHKPHWGPALRAANGPADAWAPVVVLSVEGTKVTLATPDGEMVIYDHGGQWMEERLEYNAEWGMLRGPRDDSGRRTAFWISRTPITPCTA
ncbi:hypothetical protein [Corynebacterium timonense]|uniref:Uncharacterized protein n=1 Tax=Corynebacterium timonense TaxID=441500 RepID=A0A1H1VE42_9CORY|nr:hypothetical protein [Corynebacterium timonense]SDS82711.1 hypothetical protein SAMN04488539_2480 [Corynebacterium timonense]